MHFDLKGAPPKVSYLKQIFPVIKEAGANAIVLEYEDMFPFSGPLSPVPAKNAYTKEDVQTILNLAKSHNFEIIPLVQTFGHLEFVLKLKEFRELREVDDFPQAICPSRNESFSLVENIIDQVMALHPNTRWLHIGCDEVYHLGYCSKCMRLDRDNLFLSHVARVARYVREKHKVNIFIIFFVFIMKLNAYFLIFFFSVFIEHRVFCYYIGLCNYDYANVTVTILPGS